MPMDTERTPLLTPATAGLSSKILSEVSTCLGRCDLGDTCEGVLGWDEADGCRLECIL